jgi:hypothetical protein
VICVINVSEACVGISRFGCVRDVCVGVCERLFVEGYKRMNFSKGGDGGGYKNYQIETKPKPKPKSLLSLSSPSR